MLPPIIVAASLALTNAASHYKIIFEAPASNVSSGKLKRKACGIVAPARLIRSRVELPPPLFRKQRIMIHSVKTCTSKNRAQSPFPQNWSCLRTKPRAIGKSNGLARRPRGRPSRSLVAGRRRFTQSHCPGHEHRHATAEHDLEYVLELWLASGPVGCPRRPTATSGEKLTRKPTASHAQTLVKQFLKLENKRYKPIVALAPTVAGDTAASALVQFEQSLHQDVLTVKTQVLPQFRLLVGATFVAGGPKSRMRFASPAATSSNSGPGRLPSAVRLADQSNADEVAGVLFSFQLLLTALEGPLENIASAPNTSCAWVASHSLSAYSHLLDVIQVFDEVLGPFVDAELQDSYVAEYNRVVGLYNAAVTHTNQILASNQIITH